MDSFGWMREQMETLNDLRVHVMRMHELLEDSRLLSVEWLKVYPVAKWSTKNKHLKKSKVKL